ncbi:MAG: Flp pilus assembly protein CpaB, partial [Bacillota bacterium]|nr:Flp pilus assembly protein CpaB [Bacillota bacterium]
EKSVLPDTLTTVSQAEGKIASSMIAKGETILAHHLISENEEDMYVSRKVKEGYRAVSIGVNFNQSVSNLIEPEDEVDAVYSKGNKDQGTVVTVMLVENARVLAVGRKFTTPEFKKEPYAEYNSITLELKPEDALKLVNGSEQGSIHFILHKRPAMKEENTPVEKN